MVLSQLYLHKLCNFIRNSGKSFLREKESESERERERKREITSSGASIIPVDGDVPYSNTHTHTHTKEKKDGKGKGKGKLSAFHFSVTSIPKKIGMTRVTQSLPESKKTVQK